MIFCPTAHLEVERSTRDCQGVLGYKAGLSKIGLLPKKLPSEDPFSVGFCGSDADV